MVKAVTLCISSHSLPQAMERSAQSEHTVPHEQKGCYCFLSQLLENWTKRIQRKKKSSPYKNYFRTIMDTWHPLLVDGSQK